MQPGLPCAAGAAAGAGAAGAGETGGGAQGEPLPHGPFLVQPDGALLCRRPPAIRFAWRGRDCELRLEEGMLSITARAGEVPYTAEAPAARGPALAEIGRLPGDLPDGWRLKLLPDHRIRLEAAAPLAGAATATLLLQAMVGFALALDPYLDRLESAGVAPGVAPGVEKT